MAWKSLRREDELNQTAYISARSGKHIYIWINSEVRQWLRWGSDDVFVRFQNGNPARLIIDREGPGAWTGHYKNARGYRIDLGDLRLSAGPGKQICTCKAEGAEVLTVVLPERLSFVIPSKKSTFK